MIRLINKISDAKASNLVYLVEKTADIKQLSSLFLDQKIYLKIEDMVKNGENDMLHVFMGDKHFENIYILFYNKKGVDTLEEFLGSKFPNFPESLTLLTNSDENIDTFLTTAVLSRYEFDRYKTKKTEKKLFVVVNKDTKKLVKDRLETLENICFARDLGETPASDLSPKKFAEIAKKLNLKNTKIKVITPTQIEKKKMGLIWGVGKGSENKPCMVILERIVDKKLPTYGVVGKGIVFDTGGLDIKTQMMYKMKYDMCGAGTTLALAKNLDREKNLHVNMVFCLCIAENAVSGESYRPSDILTSYTGKTVNITNTDAEGRLVLADGVGYLSKNYKIDNMMTIATLTGVALFAMGFRYAAVMGTDSKTISALVKQSKKNFEKYCELPFEEYYINKTKSKIADLDNWTDGIYAGSTMGGAFIANFLENKEKYTHLDIAGVANNGYEPYGLYPKSSTGFGVDSLSTYFKNL